MTHHPLSHWLVHSILVATPKWPSSYCLLCPFTQRHYDVRVAWLPYFPKLWFTSITEWPHLLSHSGTSLFDAAPGRQEHLCIRPGHQYQTENASKSKLATIGSTYIGDSHSVGKIRIPTWYETRTSLILMSYLCPLRHPKTPLWITLGIHKRNEFSYLIKKRIT